VYFSTNAGQRTNNDHSSRREQKKCTFVQNQTIVKKCEKNYLLVKKLKKSSKKRSRKKMENRTKKARFSKENKGIGQGNLLKQNLKKKVIV
jgi:hypothetical protein